MPRLTFSDAEIQSLFGHEAAEDEDPKRLREYYFKTAIYDQVTAPLPLRIVVGHKGIGKSALFKVAIAEDIENNELPILIKPDDIAGLDTSASDFLTTIRLWKQGLIEIIARKVLSSFGLDEAGLVRDLKDHGGRLLSYLESTFKNLKPIDFAPTKTAIISSFLNHNRIRIYIDDLDRGWQGRRQDVSRVSALLNAVRDIANENRGIGFKIGLRSDVYYLVRTSDESTDKIEGSVVWLTLVQNSFRVNG